MHAALRHFRGWERILLLVVWLCTITFAFLARPVVSAGPNETVQRLYEGGRPTLLLVGASSAAILSLLIAISRQRIQRFCSFALLLLLGVELIFCARNKEGFESISCERYVQTGPVVTKKSVSIGFDRMTSSLAWSAFPCEPYFSDPNAPPQNYDNNPAGTERWSWLSRKYTGVNWGPNGHLIVQKNPEVLTIYALGFDFLRLRIPWGKHFQTAWRIGVPHWFLIPVLSLFPLIRFSKHARNWRRIKRGRCVACGYDLRATPGICPECGNRPSEIASDTNRLKSGPPFESSR